MLHIICKFVNKNINAVFKFHPATQNFIDHNENVFTKKNPIKQRKKIVLFELNKMQSAQIAYSYLANVLSSENNAQIVAYTPREITDWREKIIFKIKSRFGSEDFGVYRSFGVKRFIYIAVTSEQTQKAQELFNNAIAGLNTKQDIETMTLNGVPVGNLIYDSYLKSHKKPTIEIDSQSFRIFLLQSIKQFVFWEDFFNRNEVRAINVSHCVYNIALPLRLAVHRDIPVFQANITHVYRMSSNNLFAYNDFFYFRERFKSLPPEVREAGIIEAKNRITRRFEGEVGVDMAYSTKSAYGAVLPTRLLRDSERKKILVATHCFFDSPHSYGDNIFPDFYEWLDFLGKITEITDYDWYIKTHPDYLPGTKEIIDSFISQYPRFTLLPSDASHHQLISEGIDYALTVYGTIAFEYAALGVPVINASQNNPHIAYNFNLHATDIEDYRQILLGLDHLCFIIDKSEVYEYYFMRYIFNTEDLFFNSYDKVIVELGGYSQQFTPAVYDKWLNELNAEKHSRILSALRTFYDSGDFRMDYRHYGHEFTVDQVGSKS